MPIIKNRHRLKSKDIKKLQLQMNSSFKNIIIDEKSNIETGDFEELKIILVENIPCFQIIDNKIIITVFGINKYKPSENYVTVDMGAIKFVTNGADVMAPGIVDADINIKKDDIVWICDERYHKPLATGIAIMTGEQMKQEEKGKAVQLIFFVGDGLWKSFAKSL